MRRVAIGIFFGFCGMFLQNLTEWVFRHLPLYYTFHVMLGTLMSLHHAKRCAREAAETAAQASPRFAPAWPAPNAI